MILLLWAKGACGIRQQQAHPSRQQGQEFGDSGADGGGGRQLSGTKVMPDFCGGGGR